MRKFGQGVEIMATMVLLLAGCKSSSGIAPSAAAADAGSGA